MGRNGDCDADGIGMNDSPGGESRYRCDDVLGERGASRWSAGGMLNGTPTANGEARRGLSEVFLKAPETSVGV